MDTSVYPELVALTDILSCARPSTRAIRSFIAPRCAEPAAHAALVLAFDGDEVDAAGQGASAGPHRRAPTIAAPWQVPQVHFTCRIPGSLEQARSAR